VFLDFVISSEGIKVEAITSWPVPKSINDIQSFHELVYIFFIVVLSEF
jgi:hypothetical protein